VGGYGGGDSTWRGQNEPRDLALWVHRGEEERELAVEIRGPRDEPIALIKVPAEPGMHDLRWDGALDRKLTERRGRAPEGAYVAQLVGIADGDDEAREEIGEPRTFQVRRDPMLDGATPAEMAAEESAGSTEGD